MSAPPASTNPKGLATLAMLKAFFDSRKPLLDMFRPFALDAIAESFDDHFDVTDARNAIRHLHSLDIPSDVLKAILGRLINDKFLVREGGRYFPTKLVSRPQPLRSRKQEVEQEHKHLTDAFLAFVAGTPQKEPLTCPPLDAFLRFLGQYHVQMLLVPTASSPIETGPSPSDSDSRTVAQFINHVVLGDPQLAQCVRNLMEGFVLQNVLLMKDVTQLNPRFRNLTVFLDTRFLFWLCGCAANPLVAAARESATILKSVGARLACFKDTIDEMRGILRVYVAHLGTASGIQSLFGSELTRFFVSRNSTPSDVQQFMVEIDRRITELGINIKIRPEYVRAHTWDEAELAKRLSENEGDERSSRVTHDVKCVAAILQLRNGQTSLSIDDAVAVFATTTPKVVKNINTWYRDCNGSGIPPVVNMLALTCAAWIRNPSVAPNMQLHELVALCTVALRPSEELWDKFLGHLRRLVEEKQITSDEAVSVIACNITDDLLGELYYNDVDASSVREVVERVKEQYAQEFAEKARNASEKAEEESERRRALESRVTDRVEMIAKCIGDFVYLVLCCGFGYAALLAITGFGQKKGLDYLAALAVTLFFTVLGFLNLDRGTSLKRLRHNVRSKVRRVLDRWLLGS